MKKCTLCGTEKSPSMFHTDKRKRDGLRSACKECANSAALSSYHSSPSQKESRKAAWMRYNCKKYGITVEEYIEMFNRQGHSCKICSDRIIPMGSGGRMLVAHIDHCHSSGKVRGLLCHACNVAIGKFKDSPDNLRRAAEYLEGFQ